MKNLTIAILILVSFACEKQHEELIKKEDNSLIGTWVFSAYEDDIRILKRSDKLQDNYGIIFKEDYKVIERKNSSFCGTPPILYADYNGDWKEISDKVLELDVEYWGGNSTYKMEIVSIDSETLKFRYIYDE